MDEAIEKSAMRKIYLRLLPFAILSYFLAYIDRINVSFAGLTMRGDLDMSATAFGFAARHLLLGLFHLRGAEQRHHGKGRRAAVDRPHHDHLGHPGRRDGLGYRVDEFRRRALPAGRRRGRVLPGHRALLHLLVPQPSPARIVSGFLVGLPIAVAAGAPISTALLGWTACSACGAGRSCTSPRRSRPW